MRVEKKQTDDGRFPFWLTLLLAARTARRAGRTPKRAARRARKFRQNATFYGLTMVTKIPFNESTRYVTSPRRTVKNSIRSPKSRQGMKSPGQDRRSHRRYPVSVALKYSAGFKVGHGRTINLSEGGVLFEADVALPINLPIELSLSWPVRTRPPAPLELYAAGKTVRVEGTKVAVKFDRAVFRTGKNDGDNNAGRKPA
jgi:PilZ domain-containing protein